MDRRGGGGGVKMANPCDLKSEEDLKKLLEGNQSLVVLSFWMPWSEPSVHMNDVLGELAKEHEQVQFVKVEAEALPKVCLAYKVIAVPTTVFVKNGKELDRVNGAHAADITSKTKRYADQLSIIPPMPPAPKEDINDRLKRLIDSAPCMVFMKGTPEEPRCGFSRQMVGILKEENVKFSSFDILADEEVRQGLKTYSNWPTYPQLYVNGELVGGLDIVKEMKESGDLGSALPKSKPLEERLKELINMHPVVLFMKGSPQEPRCGFSKTMVALLNEEETNYKTFDILQDQEVRQGLKTYSNWPTYPQLYVNGELVGGLDIVKEMKESGDLATTLNPKN